MNSIRNNEISPKNTYCPSGWSLFSGMCYFIYNNPLKQAASQSYCPSIQKYSYLSNIESQEEFAWIQSYVQNKSISDVWVKETL